MEVYGRSASMIDLIALAERELRRASDVQVAQLDLIKTADTIIINGLRDKT